MITDIKDTGFGTAPLKQEGKPFIPSTQPRAIIPESVLLRRQKLAQDAEEIAKNTIEAMHPVEFCEFVATTLQAIVDDRNDKEKTHIASDNMVENLLIALGYEEAVRVIRLYGRFYA
jgi:hypothetical protein